MSSKDVNDLFARKKDTKRDRQDEMFVSFPRALTAAAPLLTRDRGAQRPGCRCARAQTVWYETACERRAHTACGSLQLCSLQVCVLECMDQGKRTQRYALLAGRPGVPGMLGMASNASRQQRTGRQGSRTVGRSWRKRLKTCTVHVAMFVLIHSRIE